MDRGNELLVKNQNDSQLYDILGCQSGRGRGQRDADRASSENRHYNKKENMADETWGKKSTAHHDMFDASQAPWGQPGAQGVQDIYYIRDGG